MRASAILFFYLFSLQLFAQSASSKTHEIELRLSLKAENVTDTFAQYNPIDKNYTVFNTLGQFVMGNILSVVFSFLPASASFAHSWGGGSKEVGYLLGGLTLSAYMLGAGTGVYWIAHSQNKGLSYWGTCGYAAIGGAAALLSVAILSTQYNSLPGYAMALFFLPTIGAMIYASDEANWPDIVSQQPIDTDYISHQEMINRTKLFEMELLRVEL
ncbi:MAG: hypothetical protein V1720_06940 [bacterium]